MIGEISGTAEEEAAAFVKAHVTKPVAAYWGNRGAVYLSLGNTSAGLADLTQAIDIDADAQATLAHRGYAYFSAGDYERALHDLSKVSCTSKADAQIAYLRGRTCEELSQWRLSNSDGQ